ncbi:MAG: branched-chain amino acid aminotransferase [Deltaproteobacteria bacterium]|nr:branched-chain amino acid aminotransferase [Deltaproteobacteria bacterium]
MLKTAIEITRIARSRLVKGILDDPGFGHIFADHMFVMDYAGGEWKTPRICPFGDMQISPALCSLHYGQAIFEGLKAFHTKDGTVNVFRPEASQARLNRSGARLCIPPVDRDVFLSGLTELLRLDREWVPKKHGFSLYIRPFVFATDNYLGVKVSETYRFMIITSPVGAYYKEGLNPVSLMTSGEFVRAVRGGLGEAKTPANYAASILPANEAKKKGFTQVLWLDGVERRYIEEVGTMNIFFLINDELITPSLTGSVLSGITRDSVMILARQWGMKVVERRISIDELIAASDSGTLREVFGTGTAAVISPVGEIAHGERKIVINNGRIGEFSHKVYEHITGIQYGDEPDTHGWCHKI